MKHTKWMTAPLLASLFLFAAAQASRAQSDSTPKQDIKTAGTDTKDATKKTGHAVAKGTKVAAKDTAHGTKTAAVKTKNATKKVFHGSTESGPKTDDPK